MSSLPLSSDLHRGPSPSARQHDRRYANHFPTCLTTSLALLAVLCAPLAGAEGAAWLPEPGTGDVSVSFVHQNADEFWHCDPAATGCPNGGTTKTPTPGGGEELRQNTLWLNASYGISDSVALDAQLGWAKSAYPGPGPKDMGADSLTGIADFNVGLRWRIADEIISDWPTVTLRVGAILAGNYDTGYINSLGDGGNGVEASVIVGKFFAERAGFSAEVGLRNRSNGIPAETFVNLSGLVTVSDALMLALEYRRVNAEDSIDIGGPGFSPMRFPEVEEDISVLAGRAFFNLTDSTSASVFYGTTVDGRNTAASGIFGATLSYAFRRD